MLESMGARNRVGIGLSYRPARLPRLEESLKIRALSRIFSLHCVEEECGLAASTYFFTVS